MTAAAFHLGLDLGRSAVHGVVVDGDGRLRAADVRFLDTEASPLPAGWLRTLLRRAGTAPVVRVVVATSRLDDPALLPPARVTLLHFGPPPAMGPRIPGLDLHLHALPPTAGGAAVADALARIGPCDAAVLVHADGPAADARLTRVVRTLGTRGDVPLLTATGLDLPFPDSARRLTALLAAARLAAPVRMLVAAVTEALTAAGIGAAPLFVGGDGGLHPAESVRAAPTRLVHGASAAALLATATAGLADLVLVDGGGVDLRLLFRDEGRLRRRPEGGAWEGVPLGPDALDVVRLPLGGDRGVRVDRHGRPRPGPETAIPLVRLAADPTSGPDLRRRLAGCRRPVFHLEPGPPPRPTARPGRGRRRVAFTLTDAARLLGRSALGAEEAARTGAARLAAGEAPPERFARRLLDLVEGRLAAALVAATLARSGDDPAWLRRALAGPVVAAALAPTGGLPDRSLVTVHFRLMRPLVGGGGFAPCLLERPAIRLDAPRLLPAAPALLAAFGTLHAPPRAWAVALVVETGAGVRLVDGTEEIAFPTVGDARAAARSRVAARVRARLGGTGTVALRHEAARSPGGGRVLVVVAAGEGTVTGPPPEPEWR